MESHPDNAAECDVVTYDLSDELLTRKTVILNAMKSAGLARITVTYSGSGDEGQIDEVEVVANEGCQDSDPEITDENGDSVQLSDFVESFVDDLIDESPHSGYQNCDGGSGSFTFTHDGVTWEHGDYYTERDVTEYSIT